MIQYMNFYYISDAEKMSFYLNAREIPVKGLSWVNDMKGYFRTDLIYLIDYYQYLFKEVKMRLLIVLIVSQFKQKVIHVFQLYNLTIYTLSILLIKGEGECIPSSK